MAMLRLEQAQIDEGMRLLRRALNLGLRGSDAENAQKMLASIESLSNILQECRELRGEGKHEEAEQRLQKILSTKIFGPYAAMEMSLVLADQKKDLSRAEELARKACDALCEHDPRAADALGWVYVQEDKLLFAKQLLDQAVTADPDQPLFQFHRGVLLYRQGKLDEARDALTTALQSTTLSEFDRA